MPETTQTRYFKLDTKDTSFSSQTYWAAWRSPTAVLFFIDDNGTARVQWVLDLPQVDKLRDRVQIGPDGGITDVVGISELSERPPFGDVDLAQFRDPADVLKLGTILEV